MLRNKKRRKKRGPYKTNSQTVVKQTAVPGEINRSWTFMVDKSKNKPSKSEPLVKWTANLRIDHPHAKTIADLKERMEKLERIIKDLEALK